MVLFCSCLTIVLCMENAKTGSYARSHWWPGDPVPCLVHLSDQSANTSSERHVAMYDTVRNTVAQAVTSGECELNNFAFCCILSRCILAPCSRTKGGNLRVTWWLLPKVSGIPNYNPAANIQLHIPQGTVLGPIIFFSFYWRHWRSLYRVYNP